MQLESGADTWVDIESYGRAKLEWLKQFLELPNGIPSHVGGDFVGVILSGYILLQAFQFGLPRTILVRMLFNIAVDGVVGSLPLLGDLFDTTWKAKTKNVNLLEAYLRSPEASRQADRSFLFLLLTGLLLIVLAMFTVAILLVRLLQRVAKL